MRCILSRIKVDIELDWPPQLFRHLDHPLRKLQQICSWWEPGGASVQFWFLLKPYDFCVATLKVTKIYAYVERHD